ncbi:MAG: hypothetical protein WAM82_23745 [Thermoanaerobaculia bacterium]
MIKQGLDDLEAVRAIITALEGFQAPDQERIIRWAREKLGLGVPTPAMQPTHDHSQDSTIPPHSKSGHAQDIKTFVQSKNPQSDNQFTATVAYYYRFEAPEAERKEFITATDIQEATRKVGRDRISRPSQTLINAHKQGLIDKAGERGAYTINTVGENLVAMALPSGSSAGTNAPKRRSRRQAGKASKGAARPAKKLPRKNK